MYDGKLNNMNPSLNGQIQSEGELNGSISKPSVVAGVDGATFTPHVSEEGVISWTNDGERKNPDPVNIKGDPGEKGDPGKDGVSITNARLIKGSGEEAPVIYITGAKIDEVIVEAKGE